ncbi:MAG: hypothetical protein HPY53_05490 [Brevinematales bacterium]|nr:hypothetical protein [Brevinematales bacterium]
MDFQIRPEKNTTRYQVKPSARNSGKLILPIAAAMIALVGCGSQTKEDYPPLAGKPVYNPPIYEKAQMNDIASNMFGEYLDITFNPEQSIKLKDKSGTIEFTADGYNEKYKIAYEWVGLPTYKLDTNQKSALSESEISLIKNYKFDSTYIYIIYEKAYYDIYREFWPFYEWYTNEVK